MKVLPQMREQKIRINNNITSIAGYMGLPYRSMYSAQRGRIDYRSVAYGRSPLEFILQMLLR
jgi:hypothetical protein